MSEFFNQSTDEQSKNESISFEESKEYFLSLSEEERFGLINQIAEFFGKQLITKAYFYIARCKEEYQENNTYDKKRVIGNSKTRKELFENWIDGFISSTKNFSEDTYIKGFKQPKANLSRSATFLKEALFGGTDDKWVNEQKQEIQIQFQASFNKGVSDYLNKSIYHSESDDSAAFLISALSDLD